MAGDLEDRIASLNGLVTPLVEAWGDGVVSVSSRLGLAVTRTVEAADANADSAAGTMAAMAAECRARAVVCDEYTVAMGNYRSAVGQYQRDLQARAAADPSGDPGPAPSRPRQPIAPTWADEG